MRSNWSAHFGVIITSHTTLNPYSPSTNLLLLPSSLPLPLPLHPPSPQAKLVYEHVLNLSRDQLLVCAGDPHFDSTAVTRGEAVLARVAILSLATAMLNNGRGTTHTYTHPSVAHTHISLPHTHTPPFSLSHTHRKSYQQHHWRQLGGGDTDHHTH